MHKLKCSVHAPMIHSSLYRFRYLEKYLKYNNKMIFQKINNYFEKNYNLPYSQWLHFLLRSGVLWFVASVVPLSSAFFCGRNRKETTMLSKSISKINNSL